MDDVREASNYIVEMIGPDGLKHHVGPFKGRADAEAWIVQHSAQKTVDEDQRDGH